MAQCRPDQKPINGDIDLSSITSILKIILASFDMFEKPSKGLPPIINLIGSAKKPGMSPRNWAARQMQKRNAIGITSENVFTDGPNREAQGIVSDAKETHAELQKAKLQGEAGPGTVQSIISGTAGPVPVVGTATNTTITSIGVSFLG